MDHARDNGRRERCKPTGTRKEGGCYIYILLHRDVTYLGIYSPQTQTSMWLTLNPTQVAQTQPTVIIERREERDIDTRLHIGQTKKIQKNKAKT